MPYYDLPFRAKPLTLCILLALLVTCPISAQEPTVEMQPPQYNIRVGIESHYSYTVTWQGGPSDYVVASPDVTLPQLTLDWAEWGTSTTTSQSNENAHSVRIVMRFVPTQAGEWRLPTMDLRLLKQADQPEMLDNDAKKSPEPWGENTLILETQGIDITVLPPRDTRVPWAIGTGALLLVLILALVFRPKRTDEEDSDDIGYGTRMSELFHDVTKHRLDSEYYRCYKTLVEITQLRDSTTRIRDIQTRYKKRMEEIGFQGAVPDAEELDSAVKEVRRAME